MDLASLDFGLGEFFLKYLLKIWSACFYHGVIRASTSSVAQGYNPEISKQWKIWPAILVRLWRIIRASFSQERMTYIKEESKVSYQSKACPRPRSGNGKEEKVFDALEWPRR